MGKLSNTSRVQTPRTGTVLGTKSKTSPDTRTHQGGVGYAKDAKTELFTLAVSNFVGEQTFYENATTRDARFVTLIDQVAKEDPAWTANLLYWLRSEGNMRSASIVGAVEYGRALADGSDVDAAITPRRVLDSVLQRADEPGEALGYWLGAYGRPVPKWLKRSLGDAAARLYTPFSALKYDTNSTAIHFGDVIELSQKGGDLAFWKWLIDRGKDREKPIGEYLTMAEGFVVQGAERGEPAYAENHPLQAQLRQARSLHDMVLRRQRLMNLPVAERRVLIERGYEAAQPVLQEAGMTWESVSGWIQGPMDAKVWESIIPSMGYMALLRNLRNFDESGVSDEVAQKIMQRLTDPEAVAKSRQLPFRFLSAYLNVPSDRWKHALGIAVDRSLANVPELGGRTLVLIDSSQSMSNVMSGRSTVQYWKQAALFGLALAKSQKAAADVYGFDSEAREFRLTKGENVLRSLERFGYTVHGGATYTQRAVQQTFSRTKHDRVVVLTDQQAGYDWGVGGYSYSRRPGVVAGGVFDSVPDSVPCYTYDVSGYSTAHDAAGTANRRLFAGLTDSAFKMMKVLEARHGRGLWPWEIKD